VEPAGGLGTESCVGGADGGLTSTRDSLAAAVEETVVPIRLADAAEVGSAGVPQAAIPTNARKASVLICNLTCLPAWSLSGSEGVI
jgi:hypothetical protein